MIDQQKDSHGYYSLNTPTIISFRFHQTRNMSLQPLDNSFSTPPTTDSSLGPGQQSFSLPLSPSIQSEANPDPYSPKQIHEAFEYFGQQGDRVRACGLDEVEGYIDANGAFYDEHGNRILEDTVRQQFQDQEKKPVGIVNEGQWSALYVSAGQIFISACWAVYVKRRGGQ
jgi:hypothetical protein